MLVVQLGRLSDTDPRAPRTQRRYTGGGAGVANCCANVDRVGVEIPNVRIGQTRQLGFATLFRHDD